MHDFFDNFPTVTNKVILENVSLTTNELSKVINKDGFKKFLKKIAFVETFHITETTNQSCGFLSLLLTEMAKNENNFIKTMVLSLTHNDTLPIMAVKFNQLKNVDIGFDCTNEIMISNLFYLLKYNRDSIADITIRHVYTTGNFEYLLKQIRNVFVNFKHLTSIRLLLDKGKQTLNDLLVTLFGLCSICSQQLTLYPIHAQM